MKPKLGMLGGGMAQKAAKDLKANTKRKKKRLDEIVGQIRAGRKRK